MYLFKNCCVIVCISFSLLAFGQYEKKTKVFLFAGQSNMDGRGDASKLTYKEKEWLEKVSQKINFIYKGTVGEGNAIKYNGKLNFTDPWEFVKKKFSIEKCFGPELFFGIELAKNYPNQNYLFIKRSQGGTSLYGAWNPLWTNEKAAFFNEQKKPKLYNDFIKLIDDELSKLDPNSYEIVGMLWVQGETDSNTQNGLKAANSYAENLELLIHSIRTYYNLPNLPFLALGVGSDKVIKAIKSVSDKTPNVTFVERSKNPKNYNYTPIYTHQWQGKNVGHYNYEGMKKIGQLFYNSYSENYLKLLIE